MIKLLTVSRYSLQVLSSGGRCWINVLTAPAFAVHWSRHRDFPPSAAETGWAAPAAASRGIVGAVAVVHPTRCRRYVLQTRRRRRYPPHQIAANLPRRTTACGVETGAVGAASLLHGPVVWMAAAREAASVNSSFRAAVAASGDPRKLALSRCCRP